MKREIIEQINRILNEKDIDNRIKPLIKLYFFGKANELEPDHIESQMNLLMEKLSKVEFTSNNNIVVGYSDKCQLLTVNKLLFIDGKSDEAILPIFMKFESLLNNRKDYSNCVEDFVHAGRVAKSVSAPISDRLLTIYKMAESSYEYISQNTDELTRDSSLNQLYNQYNNDLNQSIITGKDNPNLIKNIAHLFHYEVFTEEALQDINFEGPYKNAEYQEKAARILKYITDTGIKTDTDEYTRLLKNIKLFTGCKQETIDNLEPIEYEENAQIGNIVESSEKSRLPQMTEELIVSEVQNMLNRKDGYDNRIKHLIIPFFIRSQKVYNWDYDEFQERLNEVDLKTDKIIFEEFGNITTMGDTARGKIKLNARVFLNKNGKIIYPVANTLFHELGHNTDECYREGITLKEQLDNRGALIGVNYYEWTNTIFERLISGNSFYKDKYAMQLNSSGYESLSPLGSMLASALGLSEIEFAKIKDKGKEYEKNFLEDILGNNGENILNNVKDIFNKYNLESDYSIRKKRENQALLNEMYSECLKIMEQRIQNDLSNGISPDNEEYKKNQMFFLKKINYNYKSATKSDGYRFAKQHIVHDIGFCTDDLSKKDLSAISNKFIKMANYGFDNKDFGKYSTAITVRESFMDKLKYRVSTPQRSNNVIEKEKDERNRL